MYRNHFFLLKLFLSGVLFAQELPVPLDIKKAYERGTRKMDGTVADGYWQNTAKYKIKAVVDPAIPEISATAEITYTNNSPDTLTSIVFHAYHNYYKLHAKRATFFSSGDQPPVTDGMIIKRITLNGGELALNGERIILRSTNYIVRLSEPLLPGQDINLSIDWSYEIPQEGFERSGAIDPNSMFIAYWYPEIAVYDDVFGWDLITYDASVEFYHDNADFEVEITAPEDFLVWASVAPENITDILPKKNLKAREKAYQSNETVTIVSAEELAKGFKVESNVWKFKAFQFPDFSFALSNHFVWEGSSYRDEVGNYELNVAYPAENSHFSSVIQAQQKSLDVFHHKFPKYPFPYHHFTIFNGLQGGGMEFPGMANDKDYSGKQYAVWIGEEVTDMEANLGLTLHEMMHMYFPFLMGTNEKRFAWMDEGWADFSEFFIEPLFTSKRAKTYLGSSTIPPLMTQSYLLAENSGINSYTIGSYSYFALYRLLGDELFSKAMKDFMDTWKQKHPLPYDFFYSFNRSTGLDLNWFWKAWYFDWGYIDLGIAGTKDGSIEIKNIGGRPLPFETIWEFADGTKEKTEFSPGVWKVSSVHLIDMPAKEVASVTLTINGEPDAVLENNIWENTR